MNLVEEYHGCKIVYCSLELEVSKPGCFSWSGELPAAAPQDIRLAGEQVDGRWEPGWIV